MCSKTLRLIGKKGKKNYVSDPNERAKKKTNSQHNNSSSKKLLRSSAVSPDGMLYGKSWLDSAVDWLSGKTDEAKAADISKFYSSEEDESQGTTMDAYISQMMGQLRIYNAEDVQFDDGSDEEAPAPEAPASEGNDDDWWANYIDGQIAAAQNGQDAPEAVLEGVNTDGDPNGAPQPEPTYDPASFDPRLTRFDAVKSDGAIIPFATDTASSVFYDMTFHVEKAAKDAMMGSGGSGESGGSEGTSDGQTTGKATDKVFVNKDELDDLKNDPDMYGVQSLMNPYCVTRLVGGLTKLGETQFQSNMYDVRDTKRFFDNTPEGKGSIIQDTDDFTSILNPTVTNIIAWSNKDRWGRTPYSFQDFVFCKWWNIIPNNRLITFRKYGVPTFDNLNFPNMETDAKGQKTDIKCAPIATVVTYFGGDSPNKLSDFLKFATGTLWEEITADVHKVSGDTGDNPHAVIDRMNEKGGFNGVGSLSNIINSSLQKTGFLTGQYFSFAKFTGMLSPDGYSGHSQAAFDKLTAANVDPTESLFMNRIIGPVNRIQSVQKRKAGIEFSQQFTLICQYVARPIGGINTKAAILDILANCMELASPEAVFWGGGYRFMIHPRVYPFKNTNTKNNIMDALYAGKIFGNDGAIANALSGLREFGMNGGSEFKWSNVTANLGNILGQTMGAIGGMLQSISSTLFGESSKLSSWLKSGTDALSSEEQQAAGESKLNNLFGNLNKMWKDQVIQETTLPSIEGMRALLTGTPVGNWHLTIGNPLNPIMVCGNLICKKMDVEFGEELGPDDFPLELKVTYTIEHAMARDKAAIQSMFNRGSGRIYKLPDYIRATSDFETKVDKFTGGRYDKNIYTPQFMRSSELMNLSGARGYQTYKIPAGETPTNTGNPETTFVPSFIVPDNQAVSMALGNPEKNAFLMNKDVRSVIAAPLTAQKMMD